MTATIQRLVTPATPTVPAKADVIALPKPASRPSSWQKTLGHVAANVIPPLVVMALGLIIWEILCSTPGASLPAPSRI